MKQALLFYVCCTLSAQLPPAWEHPESLGAGTEGGWWGAGLWAGNGQGPPATLEDALGLGNALTGTGFHLEGGTRAGHWDFAAEVLGVREAGGGEYLTLYRSHAWWRGATGWQAGFEQEPLVWGYGLNGGYLLGEAARPFPRLRWEAPYREASLLGVPLGQWGFQVFTGRLENDRVLSSSLQDGAFRAQALAANGQPQAPFLNGYRVQALFGPRLEFYLNYLNLWGGTLNGVAMTRGYGPGEYVTALFGLKDALAEAGRAPGTPTSEGSPLVNGAMSASEIDWGLRWDTPWLAGPLGAEHARLWVSRGSKSFGWPIGIFVKNPPRYLWKDVSGDVANFVTGKLGFGWDNVTRYSAPSELNPNDNVGLLAEWPRVRFGLEYLDTVNGLDTGHRTFTQGVYLSGFYYHGDPLGEALGGEVRATTARLEVEPGRNFTLATWAMTGTRPFRDDLVLWQQAHPGAVPGKDRLTGLQETLRCRPARRLTLDLGAAWERHGAVDYEFGRLGNGFRWFTDLGYRWPGRD